jgi:PAS domain S-box-containing protein
MKIGTKLRWAVFIPLVMALLVIAALVYSFLEMTGIQNNGNKIRDIRTSITELNHISFTYILYHEERPKEQFGAVYTVLAAQIAGAKVQNQEQQNLLNTIHQDADNMNDLFSRLVANHEANLGGETAQSQQAANRLVGLFLAGSFEADTDAAQLRGLIDSGVRMAELRTLGLILSVLVLALIPMGILLFRMRGSIISSLSHLSRGAEVVGAGNLEYMFNEESRDEIGDLSHTFNQMTSNLKTVTASKKELEKEIIEREIAEIALKKSEQRWSTTLSSIGDGVIATDTAGIVTFVNRQAEVLTGWNSADALGKPVAEIFSIINEHTRLRVDNPIQRVLQLSVICGLANHTILVRKDLSEVPIDDSAAPIKNENGTISGVVLIFREISERKKAEQALKASEERFSKIFLLAPDGVSLTEVKTGRIIDVNPNWQKMFGYKKEQVIGKTPLELNTMVDSEDRQKYIRALEESVDFAGLQIKFQRKDSQIFIGEVAAALAEIDGQAYIISNIRDITDRIKANEALQQRTRELELYRNRLEEMVNQRTQELQSLSYRLIMVQEEERRSISRELHDQTGQSLTVVNLLLAKAQRSPETSDDDLQQAQAMTKEVLSQVRNLSSSLHPGMLEDLGLISTLNWYLNDFAKKTGIRADFEHSGFEGRRPPADINITIYRIIQEALTNIVRYAEVNEAEIALHFENRAIVISVKDKGKGFDVESQAQGVGLRGIRERVNALKGRLTIQSTPGQGTAIEVELPIPEESSAKV